MKQVVTILPKLLWPNTVIRAPLHQVLYIQYKTIHIPKYCKIRIEMKHQRKLYHTNLTCGKLNELTDMTALKVLSMKIPSYGFILCFNVQFI